MKTMKRMLMLGLAVGIVFLCLVGCSSEEQTLSVAKEGNPVPMLMNARELERFYHEVAERQ